MTELLNAIEWEHPIFPLVHDPEWENEVKQVTGGVADVYKRVAASHWLRNTLLLFDAYRPSHVPNRLIDMAALVTAQENACRYCYGVVRAQMKIFGYSERYISKLEREVQLAELNDQDRAFVTFCRSLSRSNPRPASIDRQPLLDAGFSPEAVAETVVLIAGNCLFNRVATFVASEPEQALEKIAHGLAAYPARALSPITHALREVKLRKAVKNQKPSGGSWENHPFATILKPLESLHAASVVAKALDNCFSSGGLPTRTKALIYSVVARTLECDPCQTQMRHRLEEDGMAKEEVEQCLTSLTLPDLEPFEEKILDWTRNTVHYQPGMIQKRTRILAKEIGEEKAMEAIGVASLANSIVRIATLLT